MADVDAILAEIEAINAVPSNPLTTGETLTGMGRGLASGLLANFADNAEAGLRALQQKSGGLSPLPLFIPSQLGSRELASQDLSDLYQANLNNIRAEQEKFKSEKPLLGLGTELAGSILSPYKYAKAGSGILAKLLTNPFTQGAVSTYGAMDEEANLADSGIGGGVSSALSALASAVSKPLGDLVKQSDRLKTSAYGISASDIGRQVRKLDDSVEDLATGSDLPLVSIVRKAEKQGLIDAGNDALDNLKNVASRQKDLGRGLTNIITKYDKRVPAEANFGLDNTIKYIDRLEGTARQKAEDAALQELDELIPRLGAGKLSDLQRLKVGLNKTYDNPYSENVVKALRSDIRSEIEKRVNTASVAGIMPENAFNQVKKLNQEYGALEELQDVFKKRIASEYGGDIVEDVLGSARTSGGTGSLNVMSAASGNPIYSALGAALNAARVPEAKSQLADILTDPIARGPLKAITAVAPEIVTSKNVAQVYANRDNFDNPKADPQDEVLRLLSEIEASVSDLESPKTKTEPLSRLSSEVKKVKETEANNKNILLSALAESGIEDPTEINQFLAQMDHESAGFKKLEEMASGKKYEGRKDLGNTQKGDGERFKGRGFIQLTGRANYKKYGELLGLDLENNPELASNPEIASKIAVAYWQDKVRPNVSDFNDVEKVTRIINGGLNGLEDRKKRYSKYSRENQNIASLLAQFARG